jgi:hypothetical protein
MAQNIRQTNLFAAEDYTVVYESYVNANFQAYDYDTIRTSMIDYVRNTYPENFNDWIESSEFVAILDLVAQFGHNLAYRVDLNARNNFLSTATRQDSVYKLAEFLGYQPRRNTTAFGEMKIVGVKTNEAVIGSAGTSLGGREIRFESSDNINNLDDFITVMNAVMELNSQFGSPKKQLMIDGQQQQFYDLNNTANQIKFDVSGIANGASTTYNIVNLDYNPDSLSIVEKNPDPNSAFGLIYKNDGKGLSSTGTGFFFGVKQGILQFKDFNIENPVDSLTLDIDVDNINQTDVWVQSVDTDGNVVKHWSRVRDVNGENIIYNNINNGIRDIFSVKTRKNNQISIRFPEKTFGNLPKNTIRVWYRTSVNSSYVVRPEDLANKKISMSYVGFDGNVYTAVFSLQLKTNIITASSNESLDSIKENAPKSYASQDRMITASDYNSMLQSQTGGVLKIKSLNRTFSGHSRYVDFNDPTGMYSSLNIFGTDGVLSRANKLMSFSTAQNESPARIFEKYIKSLITNDELINLYYDKFKDSFLGLKTAADYNPNITPGNDFGKNGAFIWNSPNDTAAGASTGYFKQRLVNDVVRVGNKQTNYLKHFTVGGLVKFVLPGGGTQWANVVSIFADGLGIEFSGVAQAGKSSGLTPNGKGAIVLDQVVPSGSVVDTIYPAFSNLFTVREQDIIVKYLESKKPFALKYDFVNEAWDLISNTVDLNPDSEFPAGFSDNDDSWLIFVEYNNGIHTVYLRTLRYYLESASTQFTNISNELELDTKTKKPFRDSIVITGIQDNQLVEKGTFYVYGYETDQNGVAETNRVVLSINDNKKSTKSHSPDVFADVVGNLNSLNQLRFEWRHIAADNQVVDPSFTNIIDVYVLSKYYDTAYRNWLKTDRGVEPQSPTTYELTQQFYNVNDKKAISDTIIYKPVKYRTLFGPKADNALQAKFNIIKVPGANITDNEVKTRVVEAVQDFFAVSNWDFGETFYFTELAAYVHKALNGYISSFVIVPQSANSVFGDLFQITPQSDEMFIPDVSLTDINIVLNITDTNIKAGQ